MYCISKFICRDVFESIIYDYVGRIPSKAEMREHYNRVLHSLKYRAVMDELYEYHKQMIVWDIYEKVLHNIKFRSALRHIKKHKIL